MLTDYSVPAVIGNDNTTPETVKGFVRNILENSNDPDGKILNGLEFPQWGDNPRDRSAYATDVVAWNYIRGKPYCGSLTTPYPTEHVRWGLVATSNAVRFLHTDSDGFSTFQSRYVWKECLGHLS